MGASLTAAGGGGTGEMVVNVGLEKPGLVIMRTSCTNSSSAGTQPSIRMGSRGRRNAPDSEGDEAMPERYGQGHRGDRVRVRLRQERREDVQATHSEALHCLAMEER